MKNYLVDVFNKCKTKLEYLNEAEIFFSVPNEKGYGDYSTNLAMTLTKKIKRNPREIATEIINSLEYDNNIISKVEIAGPGFINFHFNSAYIPQILNRIINEADQFGKSKKYLNKKAQVEFVSANPTGPLTVGHGRNAVVGDTIANMLESVGYNVEREYYFNNAGRQMRVLGDSVRHRYLELLGETVTFPEDYYQGEYIKDIAKKVYDEFGDKYKNEDAEGYFKQIAEEEIFADIRKTLERINISFYSYFNERSLYENKNIDEVISTLEAKGLVYKQDGATWLKLTELGQEQDKVIIKSSGEPTYRLPDIAYHINKFERNYDIMVDLFGSDHNATYPDVMAAVKALGYDDEKVKVVIHQFVTIMDKGEVVKMSTRKANFITLDELIDEVGADVVRYFFNMRSVTSHLNFDIDIAKKHSDENPVFYLQYAHARICSIIKMAEGESLNYSLAKLELLDKKEEQDILKKLYEFENTILYAAEHFESQKIATYLEELAALFHRFYTEHRIIGSDKDIAEARLALCHGVKTTIKNGLTILGVTAPERM